MGNTGQQYCHRAGPLLPSIEGGNAQLVKPGRLQLAAFPAAELLIPSFEQHAAGLAWGDAPLPWTVTASHQWCWLCWAASA